jgi:hypothetical protein
MATHSIATLREIANGAPQDVTERKNLLVAAKELVLALEEPDDVIERVCFQVSGQTYAVNIYSLMKD